MSEWDPDYQAGKNGWTHYAPSDSGLYQKGVDAREGKNQPGPDWGGSGGGGGEIILLLVLLPLVVIGSVFVAITFPIAGILALLAGFLVETLWGNSLHVTGFGELLILAVVGIVTFVSAMKLERRVESYTIYRWIRHVFRVVSFGGISFALLAIFSPNFRRIALDMPSLQLAMMTLGIMVATHFGSRWLDSRIASRIGD